MARSNPKPLTISDVARHAGVSLSTVSRVMNGNVTVDPALAERVRAAAIELGYTASPLARSLVLGKTRTVAVLVPDLGNPTFQTILRALSREAAKEGYHILIADSAEAVEEEPVLALEARRRTDGIVLCAPRMDAAVLDALVPQIAPVVLVNRAPRSDAPVVAADYRSALGGLIQHLYDLDHRHLVYLAGVAASASNAFRREALEDFRATHPDVVIDEIPCGVDFDSGAAAAEAVVASRATGVLAFNDLVAMGLMSTLEGRGLRAPDDISIAGFDDIPFARYTSPPLTTAAVPSEEIGRRAWVALTRMLSGGPVGEPETFAPRIARRGSTGPAPARRKRE